MIQIKGVGGLGGTATPPIIIVKNQKNSGGVWGGGGGDGRKKRNYECRVYEMKSHKNLYKSNKSQKSGRTTHLGGKTTFKITNKNSKMIGPP